MKIGFVLVSVFVLFGCVGPEELYDGLVDNIPTVVVTNKAFTYTLKADNLTFEDEYPLNFITSAASTIQTTIIVAERSSGDSVKVTLYDQTNAAILPFLVENNTVYVRTDSISQFDPRKIKFKGKVFTGELQCVLTVQP